MNMKLLRALPSQAVFGASLAMVLALASGGAGAQTAIEIELLRRVDQLAAELTAVKAQLAQVQQQQVVAADITFGTTAPNAPAGSAITANAAATPAATGSAATTPPAGPATVLTGYGEINYNRPTHQSQNTLFDVRRFVLGYQHRFDDKTKAVTELEVEHAVSSASDRGEVDVEQAYIERQITSVWALRAGLFLMPAGLLNENHEPPAFYGVDRNFVETAIIPSTWREGGLQFVGTFDNGLTVQGGFTSSFDLNKWDAASNEGKASPLGSIHQELALAKGHDIAVFGAVNWRGIPACFLADRSLPARPRRRRRSSSRASRCGIFMRAGHPADGISHRSTHAPRYPTPRRSTQH
jgi:hypothetical protein